MKTDVFDEWRKLEKKAVKLETWHELKKNEQRKSALFQYVFHSLRHTYVSTAREKGTPIDDIKYAVGYRSPAMREHYDQSLYAAKRTGELMPALGSN